MKKAWNEIIRLEEVGAVHKKKNKKINEFTLVQILSHAAEEIVELMAEPTDIEELGDAMACLVHFAVKQDWSRKEVEKAMLKKLKERIKG